MWSSSEQTKQTKKKNEYEKKREFRKVNFPCITVEIYASTFSVSSLGPQSEAFSFGRKIVVILIINSCICSD